MFPPLRANVGPTAADILSAPQSRKLARPCRRAIHAGPALSAGIKVCGADQSGTQAVMRAFTESEWATVQAAAAWIERGGGLGVRAGQ